MRTFSNSLPISSLFTQKSLFGKQFSTSSTSLSSQNPLISQKPISNSLKKSKLSNDPKNEKTHQNSNFIQQSNVINSSVRLKHKPFSALAYFKWADKIPGLSEHIDSFCVLFHMFIGCKNQKLLVRELVSSLRCFDATPVTQTLIKSANKFGFSSLKVDDYHCLLNDFVALHRLDDAISCFDVIVRDTSIIDLGESFGNILLNELVNENRIEEAELVCDLMLDKGIDCNNATIFAIIEAYLKEGRIEEAKEWFNQARGLEFDLSEKTYNLMIGVYCKYNGDANEACKLIWDMRRKGLVPSARNFLNVLKVCMKQGSAMQYSRVKDEMIACGRLKTDGKGLFNLVR